MIKQRNTDILLHCAVMFLYEFPHLQTNNVENILSDAA